MRPGISGLQSLTFSLQRRRNGRIHFQPRQGEYGFYDCISLYDSAQPFLVSMRQPKSSDRQLNPIPLGIVPEAEETQTQVSFLNTESGHTRGSGRPPTPSVGKIFFGSRLAGPAARPPPSPETIRIVEGIKVPPRPEEPDNCCMS